MKKDLIKYMGILLLISFSFFYTDKISKLIIFKSPLMKTIEDKKSAYYEESLDAKILGDYIIPGLNGREVSMLDSYYQMKEYKEFNSSLLAFDEIKPKTSVNDHKNLIINKANSYKRKVSLILNKNTDIISHCEKKHIKANILSTIDSFNHNSFLEPINNDEDYDTFEKVLKNLNKNNDLCYVNSQNKDICLKNNKFLIESTYNLNPSSLIRANISPGDIIYIDDTLTLSEFKIFLQKIAYQDLEITYLSDLISEKRS